MKTTLIIKTDVYNKLPIQASSVPYRSNGARMSKTVWFDCLLLTEWGINKNQVCAVVFFLSFSPVISRSMEYYPARHFFSNYLCLKTHGATKWKYPWLCPEYSSCLILEWKAPVPITLALTVTSQTCFHEESYFCVFSHWEIKQTNQESWIHLK